MNRFGKRYSDLIFHLFYAEKWSSLAELSEKTKFSKSTIYRDLEFLETIFPEGWGFEKQEGSKIRLLKPENGTLENLMGKIREEDPYFHILNLVLMNNGVTISQISQELHISRSTVYRHLEKLKDVIQQAGVTLSASPFKIEGEEKKIRRLMIQLLEFMAFEPRTVRNNNDAMEFQSTLMQLSEEYSIPLRIGAMQRLTMIMYISNLRTSNGHFVSFPQGVLTNFKGTSYFHFSERLKHYMNRYSSRDLQLQEILYFCMYLVSEERPLNRSQHLRNLRSKIKNEKAHPFTKFLNWISEYVGFNLLQDDDFLFCLYKLLKRITLETEFEVGTGRNSILIYLPYFESNPFFQVVEEMAKKHLNEVFTLKKNDVLELFSIIQAAILRKRNQLTIQVALICSTYIERDYIREILKYHYGQQLIILALDVTSIDLIYKNEEFDLLIMTNINNQSVMKLKHIPTIKVSSFPAPSELMKINQFIEQHFFAQLGIDQNIVYPFFGRKYPC
ncbi:hypothetical protein COD67_22595 [Bacillus cereus]|nr:hypothetical protein COI89_20965 [Bacillus cereus]PGU62682.1 hypothetical protein COD67_22595 [Bacillus cereus]